MTFLKSKTFVLTVLLQVAGPFLMSFGDWANVIQYLSGFGMSYAVWHYFRHHKPQQERMAEILHRLHLHTLEKQNKRPHGL